MENLNATQTATTPIEIKIKTDREAKNCEFCGKPMLVSKGQVAKYHKACRTEGRVLRFKKK